MADTEPEDRSQVGGLAPGAGRFPSQRITRSQTQAPADDAQTAPERNEQHSGPGLCVRLDELRAYYGKAEQIKGIELEFPANRVMIALTVAIFSLTAVVAIAGAPQFSGEMANAWHWAQVLIR